jgi:hypothetical protein
MTTRRILLSSLTLGAVGLAAGLSLTAAPALAGSGKGHRGRRRHRQCRHKNKAQR